MSDNFLFLVQNQHLTLIARMLYACLCGIAIGFERKNRAKEAGVRTHCIVACASALMMIVSKYGFTDMFTGTFYNPSYIKLDPSRMAQGIVTGVGFLGAGIIYIQRGALRGLTTSAGIWATAGIGMAIGAGLHIVGTSATVIILLSQFLLHNKNSYMASHKSKTLKINQVSEEHFQTKVSQKLGRMHIHILDVSVTKNEDGTLDYEFLVDLPQAICEESLVNAFSYPCSIDFTH